jgi:hypothetical protein
MNIISFKQLTRSQLGSSTMIMLIFFVITDLPSSNYLCVLLLVFLRSVDYQSVVNSKKLKVRARWR